MWLLDFVLINFLSSESVSASLVCALGIPHKGKLQYSASRGSIVNSHGTVMSELVLARVLQFGDFSPVSVSSSVTFPLWWAGDGTRCQVKSKTKVHEV